MKLNSKGYLSYSIKSSNKFLTVDLILQFLISLESRLRWSGKWKEKEIHLIMKSVIFFLIFMRYHLVRNIEIISSIDVKHSIETKKKIIDTHLNCTKAPNFFLLIFRILNNLKKRENRNYILWESKWKACQPFPSPKNI